MSNGEKKAERSPTAGADSGLWAVRALTWFLFLQTVFWFALGAALIYLVYVQVQPAVALPEVLILSESEMLVWATMGVGLVVTAVLTLAAAISFMFHWRVGWRLAVLAQVLSLLGGVGLFFYGDRWLTFVLLGVGIFMVTYLHHPDVQTTFQTRPTPTRRAEVL